MRRTIIFVQNESPWRAQRQVLSWEIGVGRRGASEYYGKEVNDMAKAGMRRPDPSDPDNHGTENHQRPNYPKNDARPVPEIQGKAKRGHEKAHPT